MHEMSSQLQINDVAKSMWIILSFHNTYSGPLCSGSAVKNRFIVLERDL